MYIRLINMKKGRLLILFFIVILASDQGHTQVRYSLKAETGYLNYRNKTIQVDPGPDWKGYYLNGENGIDISVVNGIDINNRFFAGLGLGYVNFEGINGLLIFANLEILPLKTLLSPVVDIKFGYSHIRNQYENGTGTGFGELSGGLNYRLSDSFNIFAKSGISLTQQSWFVPFRLGICYNR